MLGAVILLCNFIVHKRRKSYSYRKSVMWKLEFHTFAHAFQEMKFLRLKNISGVSWLEHLDTERKIWKIIFFEMTSFWFQIAVYSFLSCIVIFHIWKAASALIEDGLSLLECLKNDRSSLRGNNIKNFLIESDNLISWMKWRTFLAWLNRSI